MRVGTDTTTAKGLMGAMYRDSARNGRWTAKNMVRRSARAPSPRGIAGLLHSQPPIYTRMTMVIIVVNTML